MRTASKILVVSLLPLVLAMELAAQAPRGGRPGSGRPGVRTEMPAGPVGDFFQYQPDAKEGAKIPVGPPVVTHHLITLNGHPLSYTATVGMMPIHNATTGVVEGYMFYVYYAKDGVSNMSQRPVTYCFNGGPGSSTIWLHMGSVGPYKVKSDPDGTATPPYTYEVNPNTLLDQSDLVFIDAMGTGWSRPTDPKYGADFWGVQNDLASFGEFIRSFTDQYDRWASPRFLYGESYGTTRAAGLSGYLTDHDMPVQGVILQSTIIDTDATAGDLRYVNFLPTMAMTAWYHHKVSPDLQKLTADEMSQAAVQFAGHEYLQALYDGALMTPEQRAKVLTDLHRFIGLPEDYLDENDLRISLGQFSTELLRGQHEMTSRLDSRFVGYLENGGAQATPFDFSEANIENEYLAAFQQYMRKELNYTNPDVYYVLGGGIGHWSGSYDTYVNLDDAFARNPRMHLMVAMGYYDFATPYGAVEWTLAHLKVSPEVRAHNIMTGYYQSGHMVYIDTPEMDKMRADMRRFYDGAMASW